MRRLRGRRALPQEVDVGTYRLAAPTWRRRWPGHRDGLRLRRLRRFPGGRYGNAVLVRGAIAASTVVALPRVPSWRVWQERRTALLVDAVLDDGPLRVVGTHLACAGASTRCAIQAAQFATLLRRAGHVEVPLVVAGDFNRLGGAVLPQAAQVGLAAADHGPTFPAHPPRSDIDHVLVSEHFGVQRSEVVPTAMSDHAALVVDLGLRP
ncbi:MAG: endonuclease/exonuclease/phosphatase family protein [Acidimicrobiales bacterium]